MCNVIHPKNKDILLALVESEVTLQLTLYFIRLNNTQGLANCLGVEMCEIDVGLDDFIGQ